MNPRWKGFIVPSNFPSPYTPLVELCRTWRIYYKLMNAAFALARTCRKRSASRNVSFHAGYSAADSASTLKVAYYRRYYFVVFALCERHSSSPLPLFVFLFVFVTTRVSVNDFSIRNCTS